MIPHAPDPRRPFLFILSIHPATAYNYTLSPPPRHFFAPQRHAFSPFRLFFFSRSCTSRAYPFLVFCFDLSSQRLSPPPPPPSLLSTPPTIASTGDRFLALDPSSPSGALPGGRDWTLNPNAFASSHANLPPSLSESDLFGSRDPSLNLATLAVPPMGTALDALAAQQPLNSRRPAAPTLPSFELPPPQFGVTPKYPNQLNQLNNPPASNPPTNVSVGNLLTPPASNQSGETALAHQHQPLVPSSGVSSDHPPPYWPGTASSYGAAAAGASSQSWAYSSRNSYSPSGVPGRSASATAPPSTDGLPQPFEAPPLASFQPGLPAPSSNIQHPASHPVSMSLYPSGPASSPAPLPSNDPYGPKPPLMYGHSSHLANSPQAAYSMYGVPPHIGAPGLGIHPSSRMLAQTSPGQPSTGFQRQPWPSYTLPAMSGPVLTNVHSPNSPMSVMGGMQPGLLPGFNSGHIASTQHLYGGHAAHGMPAPSPDRPFKCDQCPQSFNRNHDLKRHKRIHLAVKPFPCAHCDKSFSRKDALKVREEYRAFGWSLIPCT